MTRWTINEGNRRTADSVARTGGSVTSLRATVPLALFLALACTEAPSPGLIADDMGSPAAPTPGDAVSAATTTEAGGTPSAATTEMGSTTGATSETTADGGGGQLACPQLGGAGATSATAVPPAMLDGGVSVGGAWAVAGRPAILDGGVSIGGTSVGGAAGLPADAGAPPEITCAKPPFALDSDDRCRTDEPCDEDVDVCPSYFTSSEPCAADNYGLICEDWSQRSFASPCDQGFQGFVLESVVCCGDRWVGYRDDEGQGGMPSVEERCAQ